MWSRCLFLKNLSHLEFTLTVTKSNHISFLITLLIYDDYCACDVMKFLVWYVSVYNNLFFCCTKSCSNDAATGNLSHQSNYTNVFR